MTIFETNRLPFRRDCLRSVRRYPTSTAQTESEISMNYLSKFAVGVASLCIGGLLYLAITSTSATAQNAAGNAHDEERFQISAWSHAGNSGHPSHSAEHGAYVIDNKTGKIWAIVNDRAPREIGTVTP
jgi:hypothetical protein